MRILTNNYQDCKFLNLGSNKNGRGPYVLRQDGVSPGSFRAQEDRFFQDAAELYIGGRKLVGKLLSTTHYLLGKSRAKLPAATETAISKV
jgi:hypothetical protein